MRDAVLLSGPCRGKTAAWVLAQANTALAGGVTSLSLADLQACAMLINTNETQLSCDTVVQVVNETMSNTTNVTVEEIPTNVSQNATVPPVMPPVSVGEIRIAQWYPKGSHYVFICDVNASTLYDWRFGDGEKLLSIRNRDVYHIFKQPGTYEVTCGPANTTIPARRTVSVA